MWMDCKTLAYSLYFCYLVWIKSICITTHRVFFFLDWLSVVENSFCILPLCGWWRSRLVAKWAIWEDPVWSLAGITTNYNSISPAYRLTHQPPTHPRPGSKRETKCFDKEWISLRYFGFEARVQVGADGASSIISMLAHLPCLLIERTAFNWINCPVIYNIQRALCPLSIFPI